MLPITDGIPGRRFPIVTLTIITANLLVWLLYEVPHLDASVYQASFYPCSVIGACDAPAPWAISWLTAMFMHGSWEHILGNLLFLAIFGNNVEDAFGRTRYLAFYIAGGFVATAVQTATTLIAGSTAAATAPMLGASGAVAAVLGAYWVLYPGARVFALVVVFPVRVPAWLFLGVWFVYQLIEANYGLVSDRGDGGVAFFAHVGGFVFGVIVARVYVRARTRASANAGRARWVRQPA